MEHLSVVGREIYKILLIDDNPDIRGLYGDNLEGLSVVTEEVVSLDDVEKFLSTVEFGDGFVCDLNLNTGSYSPVNGDVIVSSLYGKKSPAILCSRDAEAVSSVRRLRHTIPCIIEARDLNPDSVKTGFEICINEFNGNFSAERKPWTALIRFENLVLITSEYIRAAVVIPGWDAQSLVEVDIKNSDGVIYQRVRSCLEKGDVYRCKATVNLDVETLRDLYITGWKVS
jgi:CheY-like chemotaxis protein